eukprot:382774-Rhodomonas_salina.2
MRLASLLFLAVAVCAVEGQSAWTSQGNSPTDRRHSGGTAVLQDKVYLLAGGTSKSHAHRTEHWFPKIFSHPEEMAHFPLLPGSAASDSSGIVFEQLTSSRAISVPTRPSLRTGSP